MADNALVITIQARDEATKVLQGVRGEYEKMAGGGVAVAKGMDLSTASASQFTRSIRQMGGALASELNPQLGAAVTQFSAAASGARLFGGSLSGAVTIGLAAAAVAATAYVSSVNRMIDAQAALNIAVQKTDFGAVTSQLDELNVRMERLKVAQSHGWFSPEHIIEGLRQLRGLQPSFEEERAKMESAASRIAPVEIERIQLEARVKLLDTTKALAAAEGARAQEFVNEDRFLRAIFDQTRALEKQADAEEALINLRTKRQLENPALTEAQRRVIQSQQAQDLAGVAARRELGLGGLSDAERAGLESIQSQQAAAVLASETARLTVARDTVALSQTQVTLTYQQAVALALERAEAERILAVTKEQLAIAEIERKLTVARAQPGDNQEALAILEAQRKAAEERIKLANLEATVKGANVTTTEAARADAQRLGIAKEYTDLLLQQVGLTKQQTLELSLQAVEDEHRLKVQEALAKNDQIALAAANERARIMTQNLRDTETLRTDPSAGMAQGFKDIADETAAAGDRMRTSVVQSFHDINRGFSDIVVAGLTGEIDKVADIGKQMGKRLLASFIDQLSTGPTSRLFASLSESLGVNLAGGRLLSAVPAVASPFALGAGAGAAGSGIAITTGGVAAVTGSGFTTQQVSTGVSAASASSSAFGAPDAISAARQFGQGFFGPGVSATDIFQAYQLGGFSAVAAVQSGQAIIVSTAAGPALVSNAGDLAGALSAGVGEAGASAAGVAGLSGSATGLGASAASIGGGILAGAALAYSAYSAYQTGDPVGGALSGAISGAMLGTIIYPGVGTVIGLIAGAAIGGGAGMLDKEDQATKARKAAEITRVSDAAKSLVAAVHATTSLDDLYALIVSWGSGNTGGSTDVAVVSFVTIDGRQLIVGNAGSMYALANQEQFVEGTMAGTYKASIQQGIAQHFKDDANAAIEQAVTGKVHELVSIEEGVLIGYNEQFQTGAGGAGGALTRQTLLSYSRRGEAAGRDLFVLQNTLDNLTQDQAQQLLEQLVKVDRDRDLQIIRVESDFGATVTIGNLTA